MGTNGIGVNYEHLPHQKKSGVIFLVSGWLLPLVVGLKSHIMDLAGLFLFCFLVFHRNVVVLSVGNGSIPSYFGTSNRVSIHLLYDRMRIPLPVGCTVTQ